MLLLTRVSSDSSRRGCYDATVPLPLPALRRSLRHQCNLARQQRITACLATNSNPLSSTKQYFKAHPLAYEQTPCTTVAATFSRKASKVVTLLYLCPFSPPPRVPDCSACRQSASTFHILFECPIHSEIRAPLLSAIASADILTSPVVPDDPHSSLRSLAFAAMHPSFKDSIVSQHLHTLCSHPSVYDRLFPAASFYSTRKR